MLKKIKNISITLASAIMVLVPVMVPVTVHASIADGLCNGINVADGKDVAVGAENTAASCQTEDPNGPNVNSTIKTIINFFSLIVGAASIIMIIFGGFRYITSGGDSGKVGGAKNTIIYALIGLIIVALSQVIVRFVLSKATSV